MTGLFTTIEQVIESKLAILINAYLTLFANKMITLLTIGLPILVSYYGYSLLAGRGSNSTIGEMGWNLARIGIILSFMENSVGLLDASVDFLSELKSGFVGAESIFGILDQQLLATQNLTAVIGQLDHSWVGGVSILACAMVWLGSIILLSSAAIVFISTEVALVLLTATAPIFIGCLTYGFLKEMFNGWLRSIFSCILTFIFASLVIRMGIDLSSGLIADLVQNPEQYGLMTVGAYVLITGVLISSLVFTSSRMASNIAGVAASSAIQGGMMAAAAATSRLSAAATRRGAGYAAQGGKNFANNTKAALDNRSKLKEANQQAVLARVKQANINSEGAA